MAGGISKENVPRLTRIIASFRVNQYDFKSSMITERTGLSSSTVILYLKAFKCVEGKGEGGGREYVRNKEPSEKLCGSCEAHKLDCFLYQRMKQKL